MACVSENCMRVLIFRHGNNFKFADRNNCRGRAIPYKGLMYGLMAALTEVQYKVLRRVIGVINPMAVDMTFYWNMFFFGNMKMLLDVLLDFGYNPMLKSTLTKDQCTAVKEFQEYYLGNKDGAFERMRIRLWKIGDGPWRKKLGTIMGSGRGWGHLYDAKGGDGNYSQVNKDDKLLVTLLLYVVDKVASWQALEDASENDGEVPLEKMERMGLLMHGGKVFKAKIDMGKKRNGLMVKEKDKDNHWANITTPDTFVPESTLLCPSFKKVVEVIFTPKEEKRNALDDGKNGGKEKFELRWIDNEQIDNEQKKKENKKRKRVTAVKSVAKKNNPGDCDDDDDDDSNNDDSDNDKNDNDKKDNDDVQIVTVAGTLQQSTDGDVEDEGAATLNEPNQAAVVSNKKQKRVIDLTGVAASVAQRVMGEGSSFGPLRVITTVIEGGKGGQYRDLYEMLQIKNSDLERLSQGTENVDDGIDNERDE